MPQNREKCKRERENKTHRRADRVVRPYKEFRRGRCPHRPALPRPLQNPCHCEPVTDVTGVAIRSPLDLHRGITDSHDQSADWSRNDTQIPSASVIASAQGVRGNPHPPSPRPPLGKGGFRAGRGRAPPLRIYSLIPRKKEVAGWPPLRLSKNPQGFSDKRLAVCCAHNLPVCDGQIPHWQPELYFLSRTCRERK